MSKFLRTLLLVVLPFVCWALYLFQVPENKEFNYGFTNNVDCNTSWIYYRVFQNKHPIDVAFLGTSHTGCGVNDSMLTRKLSIEQGNTEVANLAYCTKGRNMQFAVLSDLLKNKSPKLIIVEVLSEESVNGHKDFGYVASTDQVLSSGSIHNLNYVEDVLKLLENRFQLMRKKWTNTLELKPAKNFESNYSYVPFHFYADSTTLIKHSKKKKEKLEEGKSSWDQFKQRASYNEVRKMVDLAEKKGVEVKFLYLPSYGTGRSKPKNYDFYNELGDVLLPPESIFNNRENWVDGEHLNYKGSSLLSNWLTKELKRRN